MRRFRVVLSEPHAGWLPISIEGEGGRIEIRASYTPSDSFDHLVAAVLAVYRTGDARTVCLNEEPTTRLLTLRKDGTHLVVECRGPETTQAIRVGFDTGCRQFALKFKKLLEEVGYDHFAAEWRHRPPKREILDLWSYFKKKAR